MAPSRTAASSVPYFFVAFLGLADAAKPEPPIQGLQPHSPAAAVQDDAVCLVSHSHILKRQAGRQHKAATVQGVGSEDPLPSGWFGGFSQGESTYTGEGSDSSHDLPEWSVMHGSDPTHFQPFSNFEEFPSRFFHESRSGGPLDAWQTHYPAVSGSIAGNRDVVQNPWRDTPAGWRQDYNPIEASQSSDPAAGISSADWFDNSVHQLDGFGRPMMPSADDGLYYVRAGDPGTKAYKDGWQERSVNTTITCKAIGCTAKASLQLYDAGTEEAHRCRLTVALHPTDYDDEWSREHVVYWKANDHILTRQCNPRARGCNSTATRPLYPCVNGFDVDHIVDKQGTLVLEGKNTHMVDECPYNGNLLSAVAMGTCMVRTKPKIVAKKLKKEASKLFTLADIHGESLMYCNTPGCAAETTLHFSPALALNGGKCLMNIKVKQTDFDDHLGLPEQIDYLQVQGKKVNKKPLQPGKNPCTMRFQKKKVTDADTEFLALKDYDVTKLVKTSHPPGTLKVAGKISDQVDECGYNGMLLHANVTVTCTPPKKFAAKKEKKKASKKKKLLLLHQTSA